MKLKDIKLEHTNTKLTGYGGTKLKVKGKCSLQCFYKNSKIVGTFHVVDTNSPTVLGLQSCVDLGLIQLVMSVSSNNNVEEMLNIKIDTSVSPVVHPPRRIPTALRGKLKTTLDEIEKLGVIKKVDELTDWVSSMVVVEKPKSNKFRVCLDPKDLNHAIMKEHLELPTVEEITSRMTGAKVFSKIDLNDGY